MKGLEIVEFPFSKLKTIIDYRIESEYFLSKYLRNDEILSKNKVIDFNSWFSFINGRPYASDCFNLEDVQSVKIAKIGDVTHRRDVDDYETISMDEFVYQNGSFLTDGDILMSLTGDPPDVGSVHILDIPHNSFVTWNQRVAKITLKDQCPLTHTFAYLLLSTNHVRLQLERFAKGIRQRNLGNEALDRVCIPICDDNIVNIVDNKVKQAIKIRVTAKEKYSQAQEVLQSALSLSSYTPIIPTTAEKNLRESFIKTGRIDAEYYQPKYEHIENEIKDSVLGCWYLTDGMIADANYNPESDFLYHYIELSDIGHSGEITGYTEATGDELPTRARRVVQTDDVLLSYLEGSLTSCALIDKSHAGCLCSNGFYVLRDLPIQPEVMLVLLKSDTIQQLLHKGCSGHIMASISKDELKKIAFPILDDQTQAQIATLIRESFALRDEANQLLAEAKQLVETTIENM